MTSGMLAKGYYIVKGRRIFTMISSMARVSIGFRVFGFSASKGFSLLVLSLLGPSTFNQD